jgi:dipeptidyl aminopeptidase/acylaminoacyl peptidase
VSWSPDGKYIAYFSDESGEFELYIVKQDGSESPVPLTSGSKSYLYDLEWSPDSKKILFSDRKFQNFELSIDWKASKMANSGIFFNIREVPGQPIYYAAPEIQVLDNVDATDNKIASHLAGSLYDIIAADPKTVNPAGEWNTIVIRVENGKVTHTQNGEKVVEYEMWTPAWDEMVNNSKFRRFPGWQEGIAKEGYIGLQDHGYPVWFRNIKIREL